MDLNRIYTYLLFCGIYGVISFKLFDNNFLITYNNQRGVYSMKKMTLFFLLVLIPVISCNMIFADNSKVKESLKKYLDPKEVETLSGKIKNGEITDVLIVDVRPADVFKKAHIPGAINIPNGITGGKFEELKNKDLILYCETGGRVEFAKKNFVKDGFKIDRLLNFGGFGRYKGSIE